MLRSITLGPPLRVIEVLPPAGLVGADRLQVAVRPRADPDVLPGGRDHQALDPLGILGRQPVALLVEVDETGARAAARPAGVVRGAPPQPRHAVTLVTTGAAISTLTCGASARTQRPQEHDERGGAEEAAEEPGPRVAAGGLGLGGVADRPGRRRAGGGRPRCGGAW